MYTKTALVAALAGSATAFLDIRPEVLRRDILPEQTASPAADPCLNALGSVYANVPTPPPKVVSYQATAPPQTDPCSITFPSDITADYASYTSEVLSWANANAASIQSALSLCSTLTGLQTDIPFCTATGEGAKATGSSAPKATEGGDSGGSPSSSPSGSHSGSQTRTAVGSSETGSRNGTSQVTPNSGPRETSMVAAAVFVAGFVGVAAFL
ncbi:hypothetical protein CCHL11_06784 [Colletotrichum chlorophyti]|uniref:Infection structure specific protein n=1 Tax=Colletotrichum chlorophyti TaxID=708187 RepID=A0A1Q8S9B7_9PEZI|nr:hypothetical protein CCHL11_06784 [Colletotrichum chlorophyti]